MKFTTVFISTLVVFAFLVHRGESTEEDVIKALPNEVANILADFQSPSHFYKNLNGNSRANFTFTSTANPEVDEKSVTNKTIGNSIILVSFNLIAPDLALKGDLTYIFLHNDNRNPKYTATFTTLALDTLVVNFEVHYAFKINSIIVNKKVTKKPENYATDVSWVKNPPDSNFTIDVKEKLESVLTNHFLDHLGEHFKSIIDANKNVLSKKLHDLYLKKQTHSLV